MRAYDDEIGAAGVGLCQHLAMDGADQDLGRDLLGVLLIAASFWQVWPLVKLNRPRELATGEVPDSLVPGGTA
jgi:hypothetical protein